MLIRLIDSGFPVFNFYVLLLVRISSLKGFFVLGYQIEDS